MSEHLYQDLLILDIAIALLVCSGWLVIMNKPKFFNNHSLKIKAAIVSIIYLVITLILEFCDPSETIQGNIIFGSAVLFFLIIESLLTIYYVKKQQTKH